MDETARSEYPAMLANLQPTQAVSVLNDRVKRISKINTEIADWLQERRKVEDLYVQSLRRLVQFKVPNPQSELGVFQAPWDKIIQSVEANAVSHHVLATRIEKDIETPLRAFQVGNDIQNINATSNNLATMAKDLDEAQKKFDSLNKKGGKGNAQKLEAASTRLDSANQQWDSSAPFIYESLQALDEQRVNQLRDLLTQYQTYENEQAQRSQANAIDALASMLEISTELEIASFKERVIAGKPRLEKRTSTRQSSTLGASQASATPAPIPEDTTSEHSAPTATESRPEPKPEPKPEGKPEGKPESKLRSRIGTMLGRRRQSVHGGFGQLSPARGQGSFGRTSSSHGRPGLSPRTSASNLGDNSNRLSSLAETPSSPKPPQSFTETPKTSHERTNGTAGTSNDDAAAGQGSAAVVNGAGSEAADLTSLPRPPSQNKEGENKDTEGFTVPPPATDPITQAQRELAEDNEQLFKVNIQNAPIAEADPEANKAAISNVASTLTQMGMPSRKNGTIRGRRDVRTTIYAPSASTLPEIAGENPFAPSPQLHLQGQQTSRPPAVAALASEASIAATSDTQSVRSANSLGSLAHTKHPEMTGPGLNSSVIETVSASFKEGIVKTARINGEIAFSYHGEAGHPERETIRINNFANLEVIGPNRIFVQNPSTDRPDEFTLDLSHLGKTSTAFTYRVHAAEADTPRLAEHALLLLRSAWKPQGDKLGLLLQYSLNPACKTPAPITLHNVVFIATYEGGRASGAQTKPSGTHLKEKQLVYWRVGDVTLTEDPQKIICRVSGLEGVELKPGHIEARWEFTPAEGAALGSGISISRLEETKGKGRDTSMDDDPFADASLVPLSADQKWVDVQSVSKIVSGKYEAK